MIFNRMTPQQFINNVERLINLEKNQLNSALEKANIKSKAIKFTLSASDEQLKNYLKNFTSKELLQVFNDFKALNYNQKNLFLNVLNYNSFYHLNNKEPTFFMHTLDKEIWRIKKGLLNTNMLFYTHQKECKHTLSGFIRAFKTNSIFTTKINIDGEVRRVFVKNEIGSLKEKGNAGYNHLILDPKDMHIYNLSMISGITPTRMTLKEISKLKLNSKERLLSLDFNHLQKQIPNYSIVKFNIKKEMQEYLKRYSKRIKDARREHHENLLLPKGKSSKKPLFKVFKK